MKLPRLLVCAALGASALLTQVPTAAAQSQSQVYGGPAYGQSSLQPCTRRTESFPRGKAINLDFPTEIRQAGVTDPNVADVRLATSRRVSIIGLAVGQTDASFYDSLGRCTLILDIRVEQDTSGASDLIRRILPNSNVQVQAAGSSIIVSGLVDSVSDASKVVQIARQYVLKPDQVLNMLTIGDSDQVQLNVRVVEVNRTVIKQLGFDLNALIGRVGNSQFSFANAANFAVNGGLVGGLTGGYKLDTTVQPTLNIPCAAGVDGTCVKVIRPGVNTLSNGTIINNADTATANATVGSDGLNKANAIIKAFERAGLMRVLSEPNLSTTSGEAAKFLAGGEYPVPSGRDDNGNVIIEFKPYGVGLGFTPVVLSGGRISLKMSVEVSDLTTAGALTLNGVAGGNTSAIIPALTVRRVENTIELPSGGSMMIAGLLQDSTRQNIDKVPGIADVPIFGALARSRDFLQNETELVIIATPYLVKATAPGRLQTPADGLQIASDTQTNLLGNLNHVYSATDASAPQAVAGRSYQGPIGHVIE